MSFSIHTWSFTWWPSSSVHCLSPSKLSVCLQFRQMSAFCAINPLLCAHPFRSDPTVLLLALSEHAALGAKVVSVNLAADWGDNSVLSQQHMLKVASCQICWLYAHQRKLFQESYCVAMCCRTHAVSLPSPCLWLFWLRGEGLLSSEMHFCGAWVKRWVNFWSWVMLLVVPRG